MTKASEWRLGVARKAIEPLVQNGEVESVILTGSVAWGIADAYSDVDLLLFCSKVPKRRVGSNHPEQEFESE